MRARVLFVLASVSTLANVVLAAYALLTLAVFNVSILEEPNATFIMLKIIAMIGVSFVVLYLFRTKRYGWSLLVGILHLAYLAAAMTFR